MMLNSETSIPVNPRRSTERRVVLKFGGTSVSTRERWETIAKVVRSQVDEGFRPILVCSALSQVSNGLERLLDDVAQGREIDTGLNALRATHEQLAEALELDGATLLHEDLDLVRSLLTGASLTGEITPRLRARVLATGEVLSTRLGAAWLREQGVDAVWLDARELLQARPVRPTSAAWQERQYLSATCDFDFDEDLDASLLEVEAQVLVTQGFIARGPNGDTVLLGRGGSDTSAAYLAARSGAERLEIWTDVPGLFTANPAHIPRARLLRHLGYAEASEMAARGAKVLHPRCLAPVRASSIPLHLRCTPRPETEGTVIADDPVHNRPGIKAVVARSNMVTIEIDVEEDWQRVGLIATLSAVIARHGISIEMLSSSMNHLTLAADPAANRWSPQLEADLLADLRELGELGEPQLHHDTTAISVVATSIGHLLDRLTPLLEEFAGKDIHLISHAANDLSLTVVVDGVEADDTVESLHQRLIELLPDDDPSLGPTWEQLQAR